MDKNQTDVTVIMDRSGSMMGVHKDAEGGINSLIAEQKKQPGSCLFSLIQFDTEYKFVHKGMSIQNVAEDVKLLPRGGTALLDAVGRGIVETGERIKAMKEDERPGLVVFVIVTDGGENASKEYKREKIAEMIKHQTEVYKWQFQYIGANQDAFAVAQQMSIPTAGALDYSEEKTSGAYTMASKGLSRMRSQSANDAPIECAFTAEERAAVK